MPRTYTLTINGKRYRVTADRPLSDAELQRVAQHLSGARPEAQSSRRPQAQPQGQPQGGLYEVIDLNTGRVVYSGDRPPQPQRPAQPRPQQPTRTVEPRETPQARALAALISQPSIARQYATPLDAARAYAPAGMTEAEIRWAARAAAASAPSAGRTLWNALVRPETLAPQYDPQREPERRVGPIEGTANLLGTPLRSLATTVLVNTAQGRTFGREVGAPTQVRTWAETYAADPNWGSVLEALAPQVDPRLRQAAGVVLNAVADPLNLAGLGIVGQTGRGATRASRTLQATRRAEEGASRLQQAGRTMQQSGRRAVRAAGRAVETAGRAAERIAQAAQRPVRGLEVLDRPRSEVLSGAFGIDPEKAEFVNSPLRVFGLPLHALLDLPAVRTALQAAREAPAGERLNTIFRNLAQAQWLRREVADRGGDVKAVASTLADIRKSGEELTPTAKLEADRLKAEAREASRPSILQRALRFWKASKTSLNPPSMVRNFYQNFLFRYLTGDVDIEKIPLAVLRLLRDPERFRRLWQETEGVETAVSDIPKGLQGVARRVAEASTRAYEGADRLAAAIMGEAMGISPRAFLMNYGETPRALRALAKSGIAPFISWQYFAIPGVVRGAINHPDRLGKVARAIVGLQPDPEKREDYLQVGDREVRLGSILPVNPADFGGEMPIVDPRQSPFYQGMVGGIQALSGGGRPWPMQDASTGNRWIDTLLFLKDFFGPPALTYYLPGLISPAQPADASKPHRKPRERLDYLLGMLGFAVRPVDPAYDAYLRYRQAEREFREAQREAERQTK
ncbi:MAG: hypothetical protein NZ556_07865 [Fimbriimonadales bacterium]|nr:hypothetical protein [Fimbriimonadales bacterium]